LESLGLAHQRLLGVSMEELESQSPELESDIGGRDILEYWQDELNKFGTITPYLSEEGENFSSIGAADTFFPENILVPWEDPVSPALNNLGLDDLALQSTDDGRERSRRYSI
jgi:hypothetical protein